MKPIVVCSVLESSLRETERRLREDVPDGCGLVEIRGDRLCGDDVLAIVTRSTRSIIVTIRTPEAGGHYRGTEDERRRTLLAALRAGASYIDVELDGPHRDLAVGDHADRVILSHHGSACRPDTLRDIFRSMAGTRAARLKIVPRAGVVREIAAVREILRHARSEGRPLACFAIGRPGAVSRLMAPSWGSWGTYGSVGRGSETAEGQFPAADMLATHGVLGIRDETRRFALVGSRIFGSPSPAMHDAMYRDHGLHARYLPVEIDDFDECVPLVGPEGVLNLEGLAVTMPFKEAARERCTKTDEVARISGAVNTVLVGASGWSGFNTDGPAILEIVRARSDPAGSRVAVVGAGGTARAAAAVLKGAGARVRVFNRTLSRAREVADHLGVEARGLEELEGWKWDVLIQATPLGAAGEEVIPPDRLRGGFVLDVVYGPATPLVTEARARGVEVVDGFGLLVAQAVLQAEHLTGIRPAAEAMRRAGRSWLLL